MAEKYVNTNATFKCPALNGSFVAQELINRKVMAGGKFLMTSSGTKLTGNGNCKILSAAGGPKPCMCKFSNTLSGWQMVSENTAADSPLLLKNSFAQCNIGSVIRISDSGQNKVVKGSGESVKSLAPLIIETVAVAKSSAEFPAAQNPTTQKNSSTPNQTTENLSAAQNQQLQKNSPKEKSFIPRTGLLCSCNPKKPECQDCEYRLDRRLNPKVANSSKSLRENYEKAQHDRYDKYFDSLFEGQNSIGVVNGWSPVAHHIISGKQVLEKFPRLVKLAHFCGYDVEDDKTKEHGVNHYPNCIMLLGYPSDYGKTADALTPQQRVFAKSVDANEVMSQSKIQWHVGHHEYSFDKGDKNNLRGKHKKLQALNSTFTDNMQTVLGKRTEFSGKNLTVNNYSDAVKALLREFEDDLKANPLCYKDDAAKKIFILKLEAISRKIKQKLAAFREKPHRSYPYFVSLEAYLHAFAVPRTVHVVLIKPHKQGLKLTPWRITRYADTMHDPNKSLSFESTGEGIYLPAKPNDELIRRCVTQICSKARCFLLTNVTDETKSEALPFLVDAEQSTQGTAYFFRLNGNYDSDIELLQAKDSEIAIWLRCTAKKLDKRDDLRGDTGVAKIRLLIGLGGDKT